MKGLGAGVCAQGCKATSPKTKALHTRIQSCIVFSSTTRHCGLTLVKRVTP
jgi:hypothetical protein